MPPLWSAPWQSLRTILNETTRVLDEIADGNLRFELELQYEGDFAKIRDALMRIRTTLNDTLGSILRTAEQVTASSGQVADSASSLADGNARQASSVEELAATINEIFTHVDSNARRTEEVSGPPGCAQQHTDAGAGESS